MESISSNLKNQKGYRIGLKTVGIWAALQLYSPPPLPFSVLLLFKNKTTTTTNKKKKKKTRQQRIPWQSSH